MLVIVCSLDKLNQSISEIDKVNRHAADSKRWIAPVLNEFFLNSAEGSSLYTHKTTQIFSFTVDRFRTVFCDWIINEIKNNPGDIHRIQDVGDLIIALFESNWPISNNLVVRECLTDSELNIVTGK